MNIFSLFFWVLGTGAFSESFNRKREVKIFDENFIFSDLSTSRAVEIIAEEFNEYDEYKISEMIFQVGDVVIDIGGNVGIFSIYLAKRFPFLKIYSFEPVKENFKNFLTNIELNNITNGVITLVNKAVTKNGRNVTMSVLEKNTGMSFVTEEDVLKVFEIRNVAVKSPSDIVESITLGDIFKEYHIDQCKLLKIDCEGCEYEVLYNTEEEVFGKIEVLRGEFHNFFHTPLEGRIAEELLDFVKPKIKDIFVVGLGQAAKDKRSKRRKKRGKEFQYNQDLRKEQKKKRENSDRDL